MVFLGGAVLANIVSHSQDFPAHHFFFLWATDVNPHPDGRQREHVDNEAGMARAGAKDIRKAGTEVVDGVLATRILYNKNFDGKALVDEYIPT